jgi:hypothetical protein
VVPPAQSCQLLTLATTLWVNAFGVAARPGRIAGLSNVVMGLSRELKDESNERLARRRSDSGDDLDPRLIHRLEPKTGAISTLT